MQLTHFVTLFLRPGVPCSPGGPSWTVHPGIFDMDTVVSPGDPQVGQLDGSRNANKWNPLPVPGIELLLKVMLICSAEGNGENDMFNKGITCMPCM